MKSFLRDTRKSYWLKEHNGFGVALTPILSASFLGRAKPRGSKIRICRTMTHCFVIGRYLVGEPASFIFAEIQLSNHQEIVFWVIYAGGKTRGARHGKICQ
jgi:hypothetical protein